MEFLQKYWIYYFLHYQLTACITSWGFFYINGTKNAKASFWSLKKYKVFYTEFHSAQQNELYALIQVICLYPYPINIVSSSIYSVFVLKNIETSTINSDQPIIQQLFVVVTICCQNLNSPIYITHIWAHSCLPDPIVIATLSRKQTHSEGQCR